VNLDTRDREGLPGDDERHEGRVKQSLKEKWIGGGVRVPSDTNSNHSHGERRRRCPVTQRGTAVL